MSRALLSTIFFLIAFLIAAPLASAQSLVGSWDEASTGLTYEFRADGSGQMSNGSDAQAFTYAVQGSTLYVQSGGGTLAIDIVRVTETQAQLAPQGGTAMRLTRRASEAGSGVSANASGVSEADVMVAVRLAEFATGDALGGREIDGIRREVYADHVEDPAGTAESLAMFRTILSAAAQAQDPVAVGMARQQLLVGLLEMRRQMPNEPSPFFDAITNRVRLLAYDPATQTGATDQDVQAALDYAAWLAAASGGTAPSARDRRAYETYVVQNFGSLPRDEKEFLSAAAVIWTLTQYQWAALSQQQQQVAQQQIASQPSGWDASGYDASTYEAMSTMSARMHETSMSILNNIGDSTQEMWRTDAYGNPQYQVW
ncbi:MAG: DUF5640 domain-containing protein [Bacteroidota bacterium]